MLWKVYELIQFLLFIISIIRTRLIFINVDTNQALFKLEIDLSNEDSMQSAIVNIIYYLTAYACSFKIREGRLSRLNGDFVLAGNLMTLYEYEGNTIPYLDLMNSPINSLGFYAKTHNEVWRRIWNRGEIRGRYERQVWGPGDLIPYYMFTDFLDPHVGLWARFRSVFGDKTSNLLPLVR